MLIGSAGDVEQEESEIAERCPLGLSGIPSVTSVASCRFLC